MSCSTCGCKNPVAVVPPIVKIIREGTASASACPSGQPYETLAITTFVPQAVEATQTVKVCSASHYLIGSCVLLIDSSERTQVQRVIGHVGTDTLTLEAYTNDYSSDTNLSGTIYLQPLGICPPDTTSVTECFRTFAITTDAFVMPDPVADEGGAVAVTFTEAVSFQEGMEVWIDGAGWMEVTGPPSGPFVECSTTHYFFNIGTAGNTAGGATVTGGADAIIGRAPVEITVFDPTAGDIVDTFTDGLVDVTASINLTYPGSLSFNLAWPADLHIRWRVGHPTDDGLVDTGGTHAHWRIKLAATQVNDYTSTTNAKSDASNDADMSGWASSSNWGDVVVENVAAGAWVAWIEKYQQSGSDTFTLDTWRITVTAHRKQASVS